MKYPARLIQVLQDVAVGFFDPVIKQLRKPTSLLGLLKAEAMNLGHSKLTD